MGQHNGQVKQEDIAEQGNRLSNRLRCVPNRLGCSLSGAKDRMSLVLSGEQEPHQLLGTHGGNPCCSNICQEQDRHISSPQNKQHNSSCLHKQPWGNCFKRAHYPSMELVGVVSGKEYTHHSPAPPSSTEPNCRLRIENDDRPDRVAVEPSHIRTNQSALWSIGSGPFCLQTHYTAPSLFQLAARSLCLSNRCISTGLVPWEGVCQSPLMP